jgi:hypothetical protein
MSSPQPAPMSAHCFLWFSGIAYSVVALVCLFHATRVFSEIATPAGLVFLSVFIFLGSSAFIAAVRAWPPTLWKIASFVRRDGRPARAPDAADLPPIVLTASSLLGLAFLGPPIRAAADQPLLRECNFQGASAGAHECRARAARQIERISRISRPRGHPPG